MTSKEHFKANLIIFLALCAGQIMFALVVSMPNISQSSAELYEIFKWIVPAFGIAAVTVFNVLAKRRFAKITGNLAEKASTYRVVMIPVWAAHEGATFFALVTYMQSQARAVEVINPL